MKARLYVSLLCFCAFLACFVIEKVSQQRNEFESLKASFRRPEVIPHPIKNPFSLAKFHLGKQLFFDVRLSRDKKLACASCHNPSSNWDEELTKMTHRKAPTLINVAWGKEFFWDGRAPSLEAQALGPIQNKDEMNLSLPELITRLKSSNDYREKFERVFPEEGINAETIAKAIASFERGVVSSPSPFDRWIAGEEKAISEEAKQGFQVFVGKGTCIRCHTGWNFTNASFADVGLPSDDLGKGALGTNPDVNHTFKTPTLRNIVERAPYMHDRSLASLEAVIENYDVGGTVKRKTSQLFLKPLHLSSKEKAALIAFLQTLTSEAEAIPSTSLQNLPQGDAWRSLSSLESH